MPAIEPCEYLARFYVMTKHGSNLEFVLSGADDRRNQSRHSLHVTTTYTDQLWEMLKKEFAKNLSISVDESCEYGDLSFLVSANTPEVLQKALARCDKVVKRWINKYRINHMKGHE